MILQDTDNAEKVHCCVTPPPRPPRFCLRPIRPEREPPGVPWGRSIIYQKFTKNIRDAEKWWCIFSFARDCLLQYVPPTLESNIRREKKKTFLVMINVLHFRVHDNKTFMQNHFKAQRLIPQPASLARLASGYIYALLSGKRSSSFGWSRQMEGFIPYSKHFFFLLFFCLTKCTSHYFSFSLSRVLPSSNSDSHHWNSVSRRSFLSLPLSLSMGWYLQSEIQPNSSPCPERLVCVSPRWSTRLISCRGR